jgi:uncharacterized protein YciI
MKLFAVIRTRGDAFNDSLSLEEQRDWDAHAAFMNGLQSEGFIVLGGPLEDTPDVLLIACAGSPQEVAARLQDDPWTIQDLLRISRISPWTLRLGSLAGSVPSKLPRS